MRQRFILLLWLALFWLAFQVLIRGLFLLYNHDLSAQLVTGELVKVFLNGLKMDISMLGYILMLVSLVFTFSVFTPRRWTLYTLYVITVFLMVMFSVIVGVDLELYRHWGFRLNTTPLFYMGPQAMGSVELSVVIQLLLVMTALVTLGLFGYDRLIVPGIRKLEPAPAKGSLVFFVVAVLMILPIRGSFTVAPMNTGFVYFHKTKAFANHAAINVIWNFIYSLRKSAHVTYPENLIPAADAEAQMKELYPPDTTGTVAAWEGSRPNIILFILESFTAGVVEPLGGEPDVTPNLNQLCREGILFRNFYSSGDRTDKGLVSILSGYPSQPQTSIIKYPGKTQRLPYLSHAFRDLGYTTSFVYGGDIDFANFRSYLTNCNFEHLTTLEDFPDELNESKWGVHDHFVFERAFQECDTARSPFFKVILSLSSHEPFDVPMVPVFPGQDAESLFLNSCYYTDQALGDFIRKSKAKPWWENTVVILVADHGHRLPGKKEIKDKERFHIPFLITGGAVKKDSVISRYGGHTDIANTLLAQFGRSSRTFRFSKNLLSPVAQSFSVYFFDDGYGFVNDEVYLIYDNPGKQFLRTAGAGAKDLLKSQSYQQILFTDYNKK